MSDINQVKWTGFALPMTTKFAAFFRVTFLNSAMTSNPLLLIVIGSSTERFLSPLLRSTFLLLATCLAVGLLAAAPGYELLLVDPKHTYSRLEPFDVCAFVTTSSGLGSVKSKGLVGVSFKFNALAK